MSVESSNSEDEAVERFFSRFDELLTESGRAALAWLDDAPPSIRDLDDWVLARADALVSAEGPEAAAHWLTSVISQYPGFAEAHHRLAEVFEELGRGEEAIAQHLETLHLDTVADAIASSIDEKTLNSIADEAAATLAQLPERFRSRVGHVPVLLEPRPSIELVRSGFDSRALGLFAGAAHGDEFGCEPADLPTQITLFTHCLWDAFGLDETELLDEVRVTILHEVGHYFGLDEDELAELGLD